MIELYVHGHPAPQGSKRHVGRGVMVESSKYVRPWREAVVGEAIRTGHTGTSIAEPCTVDVRFYFPRPQAHYGKAGLKDSAPAVPSRRSAGDIDKLVRSTLDALVQASVLADDSLVVDLTAGKRYASIARPMGARIRIDFYRGDTNGSSA